MRREYRGAAKSAQLTNVLGGTTSDLTISCDDLTNWPTGGTGPFYVVVNRGAAAEEKILCSSRSGNTLTVWTSGLSNGRGADGTSPTTHNINAVIEHVFTATDADEANAHVNTSGNVHGVTGDLVGRTQAQTLTNKTMDGGYNTFQNIPAAAVVGLETDYATLTTAQTLTNKTLSAPIVLPSRNVQSSSYMLTLADAGQIVEMSGGGTLTVPSDSSVNFPVGTQITVIQTGSSQVTIAGAVVVSPAVTPIVNSAGDYKKIASQWSAVTLIKRAAHTWVAIGALVA